MKLLEDVLMLGGVAGYDEVSALGWNGQCSADSIVQVPLGVAQQEKREEKEKGKDTARLRENGKEKRKKSAFSRLDLA